MDAAVESSRRLLAALVGGAAVGVLGGLVGLGGAEFRLPLLISVFSFVALEAVILNKAISLIVVASALAFRATTIPFEALLDHGSTIINLLAGTLASTWLGADFATRLSAATLYRVIAMLLLVAMACLLVFGHDPTAPLEPMANGLTLVVLGLAAGLAIGFIAALLGVAGGEVLIPTLVFLFGTDIKVAGSLSLAISMPTMLVGFARYSRDSRFSVLSRHRVFVLTMAAGSVLGVYLGARLLSVRLSHTARVQPCRSAADLCHQSMAPQAVERARFEKQHGVRGRRRSVRRSDAPATASFFVPSLGKPLPAATIGPKLQIIE